MFFLLFFVLLAMVFCTAVAVLVIVHAGYVERNRPVPVVPQLGDWLIRLERRLGF